MSITTTKRNSFIIQGFRIGVFGLRSPRDAKGKLVSGVSEYLSEVPAGAPTPFEIDVDPDETPEGIVRFEHLAFNHINNQPNWHKLLRP